MGSNPIETPTTSWLNPPRIELLADIVIDQTVSAPLGGLNPYSPHFNRIGHEFKNLLIEHAGLTTSSRILEIGCGTGRLANTLNNSKYVGFDIHPRFIEYCNNTYKHKKFDLHNIRHDEYNPSGTIEPDKFEFPYQKRGFDLVVAIAVFNHFETAWIDRYLNQISLMLRPKGIFFGTILLLNKQSIESIESRTKPPYSFRHRRQSSWHDFETRPLFNVAHQEDTIRRMFIENNLMLREPIRYGDWCGSKIAITGPDVLIARRN